MRKYLFASLVLCIAVSVNAQDNPYAIFGYKPRVEVKESKQDNYRVKNPNQNEKVKYMEFNFDKKEVFLLGDRDSVLQTLPITNELMRWISVDPIAGTYPSLSPYNFVENNPIRLIDPDGRGPLDFVDRGGKIIWDDKITSKNDADLQKGDKYLGRNVLVGTHNRDANLNEPINSARFDLYLESNKNGPSATIMGNTVPADVNKYGTLAEGIYPAEAGSRRKYPGEQAILINGGREVPTANGNPNNPQGRPVEEQTLTGIFFHIGNTGRSSLMTLGNARVPARPISEGCQTGGCGIGTQQLFNSFMTKVPDNFKGYYYLRPDN